MAELVIERSLPNIQAIKEVADQLDLKYSGVIILRNEKGASHHRIIVEEDRYSYVIHTNALFGGNSCVLERVYDYNSDREYRTDNRLGKFKRLAEEFHGKLRLDIAN